MESSANQRAEERLARRGGAVELLRVPAALYGLGLGLRGVFYDRGWLPQARLDAPVVCVGNLSAGGTGKTPFVAWLARELARRGRRPGLLSRGYGGAGGANDEALLLAELLPGVPHVQDPDRHAGGLELLRRGADVVVMDDGFQHRRLARDLDLVLVDATRPWGLPSRAGAPPLRALLPRGLLREAPSGLARANAIVLTRVDQVERGVLEELESELERLAAGVPRVACTHAASALVTAGGAREPLERLRGADVRLLSAIGNPDAFEHSVAALGARVLEHRRFRDHHRYTASDVAALRASRELVVCTHKDLVKLRELLPAARALRIEIEFRSPTAVLAALLDALPASRSERERAALHEGLHG
jgi:tetraacyldisaccharide 4'-kinase